MENKTCDDILIKDFYKIIKLSMDDTLPRYERELQILQIAYPDKTEDELVDRPLEEVDEMIDNILNRTENKIYQEINVADRTFTLKGDVDNFRFSFRQFKVFEQAVYDSNTEYLHTLLAHIYVDDTTPEERNAFFLENMTMRYANYFVLLLPDVIEKKIMRK